MPTIINRYLASLYDRWFSHFWMNRIERLTVVVAVIFFIGHLGLIFLSRQGWLPDLFDSNIRHNYLSAIATPFTVLLFFEILLLIQAIPDSISRALGRQYEVISLIIIREVFKDISYLDNINGAQNPVEVFSQVLFDMTGGLVMFGLVTLFYFVKRCHKKGSKTGGIPSGAQDYVSLKKTMALLLTLVFVVLTVNQLGHWVSSVMGAAGYSDSSFFIQLFTIMVFADVLLLVLSYLFTSDYDLLFRNAGFVLSTIMIRFSLSIESPYNIYLAIFAMVFGILTSFIYYLFNRFGEERHWCED